jgi:hypothetical protein
MAKQNIARDYAEIVSWAERYKGRPTLECIQDYAKHRRMGTHRAGKAFWDKADAGEISIVLVSGIAFIKGNE